MVEIDKYLHFTIGLSTYTLRYKFGGKGTVEELREDIAKKLDIRLDNKTPLQIERDLVAYEQQHPGAIQKAIDDAEIGVDCSGFVYNIRDAADKAIGGDGIADEVQIYDNESQRWRFVGEVYPTNPASWVNAETLNNAQNIERFRPGLNFVEVGDTIRLKGHIIVVMEVKRDPITGNVEEIVYAHSRDSKRSGIRTGRINITKLEAMLKEQHWKDDKYYNKLLRGADTPRKPRY